MEIFTTAADANARARAITARKILVPTMGALHRGHLELIRQARAAAGSDGAVFVSIFVNPLQFEPGSDFERYPRPEGSDEEACRAAGVNFIFRPAPDEMYFADRSVFVEETSLSETLCGAARPGHFRGVCTVVTKLFHLLAPDAAVFGEKDFQQLAIIRRMVRDLNFPIEIIGVPTVRESDGLAFSSRNALLNLEERAQAPVLRRALLAAQKSKEKSAAKILAETRATIETAARARIDYLQIVDAENLRPVEVVRPDSLLAVAAFFGKTRLIDNIRLG